MELYCAVTDFIELVFFPSNCKIVGMLKNLIIFWKVMITLVKFSVSIVVVLRIKGKIFYKCLEWVIFSAEIGYKLDSFQQSLDEVL